MPFATPRDHGDDTSPGLHSCNTIKTNETQGTRPERPNESISLDIEKKGMNSLSLAASSKDYPRRRNSMAYP